MAYYFTLCNRNTGRNIFLRIFILSFLLVSASSSIFSATYTQNITACPNSGAIGIGQPGGLANGGVWSKQGDPSFNFFNPPTDKQTNVTNLDIGLNVFIYNDGNGNTLTSNVTNYQTFAWSITPTTICSQGTSTLIQLRGSNPTGYGTGQWVVTGGNPSNVKITDATLYNTDATISQPGTYTFQWIISFSPSITCGGTFASGSASVTITVTGPNLSVSASPNSIICPGNSVTLTASAVPAAGVIYAWDNGSALAIRTVTPASTTTYRVTATDGSNCKAVQSYTVNVNSYFTLSSSAASYCAGSSGVSVTLSGSETGVNYQLKNGGVNVGAPVAGNGGPITWNNQTAGTYTVLATSTATGCTMTMGNVSITQNPLPSVSAGSNQTGCAGSSFNLTATGATSYLWNNGATTSSITVSPAVTTTYAVTGTINSTGCSSSASVTVTINSLPAKYNVSGTGSYCQGSPGLSVSLSGSEGAVVNYQLLKDGVASGASVAGTGGILTWNNNTTGTYTVLATNPNCNTLMNGSAVLTEVALPLVYTLSGPSSYCANASGVTLTLSGSQVGVNYTLYNGVTSISTLAGTGASLAWNNMLAGTYTVVASTTGGTLCTKQMIGTVTVAPNPLPPANAGVDVAICQGNSVTLNATGGNSYSWAPALGLSNTGISNPVANPVNTTTYTVTVTDANGCVASDQVQVTVNIPPTPTISPNSSICDGQSTSLSVGGGTTYLWSTGSNASTISVSPNSTTTYYATVTDANACTATANTTVTVIPLTSVSFLGLPIQICQNEPAVTLTGNKAPSGTFTGLGITDNGNGTAKFDPSGLAAGNYVVTYTYLDPVTLCTSVATKSVTVNLTPTAFSVTGGGTYCQGGAGLAVGLSNSTAIINYELYLNGYTTSQIVAGSGVALNFGNKTSQGTYSIVATNPVNSCSRTMNGSAAIVIDPLPADAQVITGVTQVCPGTTQNYSVPPIANATIYDWTLPANATITVGSGTNSISVYFPPNAASGNITVTGRNACGTGLSSGLGVAVSPLPSPAGAITGKATVCKGETNVIYFIAAINNATSYVWTVPSGATLVSGQGTTQIVVNYTGAASSGNITVKGTNSCGSGVISSQAITVASLPQLTVNAPSGMITCAGNQVTVSATSTTGGATFAWTAINGGHIALGANTSNPSVDAAGDYVVTVTEPVNSCISQDTVTVLLDNQVPQNVNITATNLGVISCTNTQSTLTASTTSGFPVGYSWSAGAGGNIVSGANTASAVVDMGGVYQVTITNLNNSCISSKSITITESKVYPDISVVDPAAAKLTCSQTTVNLAGNSTTSGITYSWSGPGAIVNGSSATPTVNSTGTYTLTVTAPNGCTSSKNVLVLTDYTVPTVNINVPPVLTCSSPAVTLNGSSTTAGATLFWTGPAVLSGPTTQTPVINQPGNYTLTVTHPITGCTSSQTVTVTQDLTAPVISFPVVPAAITCTQTTSALTSNIVPANSTLVWTGPGNISNTGISNPIVDLPGVYSLEATNPTTGCVSNRTLNVADGRTPANVSIAAPSVITCTVSSVTLAGNTTTPNYSALWSTTNGSISGSNTNLNALVTKAGTYTLTITNTTSGCTVFQNVTVASDIAAPDITVDKNPSLLSCTNTQVELYGASVTPSATLLWTGPAGANITDPTTEKPKVDAIGNYTLTVTATNGCTSSDIVTVSQDKTTPAIPSILSPQTITCSRKTVQVEVSPLIANCSYLWTTSGSGNITNPTSPVVTVDAIGTYTVKVTNLTSGCSSQNSVVVSSDNTSPAAAITGGPYAISCAAPTIILDGSTSTGINPVWTATLGGHILSGGNTFKPTVDAAGTYTITTSDATTGCTSSANVAVTASGTMPTLTVDAFPAKLTCGVTTVTLSGQPTEAGTTFTWTPSPGNIVSGAATYNPVVDQPGTYILSVTKTATGCVSTAAIQVQQDISAPALSIATPAKITCTVNQVQLNASSTAAAASYAWSTGGTGTIRPGDTNVSNPVVLSAGTYTVTVTDLNNQCTTLGNVTVSSDIASPNINVDKNPLPLTCTTNSVQLSGTSLTSGVTYQWSTAGTGTIINPTSQTPRVDATGTYNLVVTNPANGCTSTDFVTVTQDKTAPNIWVNTSPAILNCINKTVNLEGNSSTANVTYLWSGPGTISDPALKQPSVDTPGTYTLTVTSSTNGCTSSLPVTVTQNTSVPAAPLASDGQACFNAPASTLTATGNTIKWYSNASLLPASKLHDGNSFTPSTATAVGNYFYFVTQTDPVSQCESPSTQVTYSVLALPSAPAGVNQAICQGVSNPALQAAGNNIRWYDVPGGVLLGNGGLYTPPASISAPGTYTYYATQTDANSCQSSATPVSLTINANPAKPVLDKLSATICQGTANPSFTASGTNIKWYDNTGLAAPVAVGNTYTPTIVATGVYPYYITQTTAQGCTSPFETVTFTIAPLPQIYNVTGGGTYCEGQNGVTIGLDGSQTATTYQLMLNGVSGVATATGNGNAFNFGFQKSQGTYSVIATSTDGCQATMSGSVPVVETLLPVAATAITGPAMVCQGVKGQIYTVPPVANATSYIWTVPPGATIITGQGTNTVTVDYDAAASSGVVTVKGSNACGQGAVSSLPVNVVSTPQLSLNTSPAAITCTAPAVKLSASSTTPGAAFSWTPINGGHIASGAGTANPTVDAAGDYTVTVVEPINSCKAQATVTVISDVQLPQNVSISASNGGIVTCAMPAITLSATTTSVFPVSYSWTATSGGHIVGGTTTANISVDKAGVYTVLMTNLNNGCTSSGSITVSSQNILPDIAVVDPATQKLTCTQTTVTLNGSSVTPGAQFSWTGPGTILSANTTNAVVNTAGTFTFTVSAPNGCTASKTVQVIADYSVPNVAVNTNPDKLTCAVTTVTLNGSSTTAGAQLLWTGPGIQSGSDTGSPVVNKPGVYTLTVYHPISGCTASAPVTVAQDITAPTVTFPVIPAVLTCTNPQTTITGATSATTPTYLWTTGNGTIVSGANTVSAMVSKAGTYMLSVKDNANGCSANASLVVNANQAAPDVQIAVPGTVTCTNPAITLAGSSVTTPITIVWSTTDGAIASGSTSFSPSVTKGGTYVMTITNTNTGCVGTSSVTVPEDKAKPVISIDKSPATISCGNPLVSLNGNASGASLQWTGPASATIMNANAPTPSVNKSGRYYLTATGTNGCVSKDSTDVPGNYLMPQNVVINAPATLTCTNSTIQLTGSSSTPNVLYNWSAISGGNIISSSLSNIITIDAPGTYKMVVSHPSSLCKDSATVVVLQDLSAPSINFPAIPATITCVQSTSTLTSSVTPVNSSLVWSGPGTISNVAIPNPTVNAAGVYTLTATHPVTGCKTVRSLTVPENKTVPGITITNPSVITCTQPAVTIHSTTTVTNYTALWTTTSGAISGSANLLDVVVTKAGLYTLTVTDNTNGCSSSKNVLVTADNSNPDVTVDKNPAMLTCTVSQVELLGTSSTTGVIYSWAGPGNISGANTQKPKVDAVGDYILTVTALNGCTSKDTVTVSQDKTTPAVPNILAPAVLTCNTTTVNLEVSPVLPNVDYVWSTTGTGTITNGNTAIATVDAIGTYKVVVTNRSSGCTNQNTVTVAQNKSTSTALVSGGPFAMSCATNSITLDGSASTGINPVWTSSQGGHIVSGATTFLLKVDAPGTYTLTVSDPVTGCQSNTSIPVLASLDLPTFTIDAYPPSLTCSVSSVTLYGQPTQPSSKFIWTASPGNIVSGAKSFNPVVNQAGTYILTVTDTITGCVNTAAIQVNESKTPPLLSLATPGKFTCTTNQVQLNASSTSTNVTYTWSTSGGGSIKPGDENVSNPVVLSTGTYTVTLTDFTNQCTTVGNVIVTQDKTLPDINVNKSPAQLSCIVKQVVLSGNSLTSGVSYHWTTTGAGNIINAQTQSPTVDAVGYYKLTVLNPVNGCSASDSVQVTNNLAAPNIWVNTKPDTLNCTVSSVKISGNSSTAGVTYAWSGAGNISDATLKEPMVDAPGTYYLTVTSSVNGCTSSLPVTVVENKTIPAAPVVLPASACYGAPATILVAAGNNIKWYSDATLSPSLLVHSGNTYTPATATPVGTYNYFVTQTDPYSHCEGPASQASYNVLPLPAQPVNIDNALCQGFPNPSLQAAGTNIRWYSVPGGVLLASGTLYTPPATVSVPGIYTYYATQTDANGCESQARGVNLEIHSLPSKPLVDKLSASVCEGVSNPSFIASGSTINWYASASLPAPIKTGSSFTPLVTTSGTYNYYVTQTNSYGCVSPYETVTFNINPLPQKFTVTGGGVACENLAGLNVGLSGSEATTSYQLLLNGTTIVSSLAGTGAALDFGLQKTAGNYTILGTGNNGCSVPMTGGVSIVTSPLPLAAGAIAGQNNVCQGAASVVYSVSPVTNATSYSWTVPAGATITSGVNSNTITVDYTNTAVSGPIRVYGINSCGNGTVSTDLQVVVGQLPAAASNIKYAPVNNAICLGDTNVIYEVDPIANAIDYEWVLPAGATIQWGFHTRQIKVRFAPNAAQGTQYIKVRGVNSCGVGAYSAPYSITVFSNPPVYAGIDQNICSSQTTLQGSMIPAGGTGAWDLISGSAVISNNTQNSSTLTSVAQGENILVWTVSQNGCYARDTVKIINNQVNVDAGQNLPICSTDIILQGSALPAGTSGMWSVASGSASFVAASQPKTRAYNFGYGDTKLYWTVTKTGCNTVDSVTITNYRPSTPDAGPDQTICTNQAWLAANQPVYGTGQWKLYSGSVTFANSLQRNTQITSVAPGKNVLVWNITNQICSLSDTVVIQNNAIAVNAGYDQILCDNRATLDATVPPTGATGQWSVLQGSASFLDPKVYNTKVSGLVNGVNKLVWAISKGSCTNTDTVNLISNMPTLANAGPDQEIPSSSTIMAGNAPVVGSGKWTVISGAAVFANDTLYNSAVSGLNPGINIFRWTITNKGCFTYDDVQITNGTLETIDAGQNQTICSGETQLEATRPLYGFGKWTVQKGSARFEDNELYNSKVYDLLPGQNILRWSVTLSGVEFYDTVVIVNNKPTTAIVGPKQVLCGDSSVLTGNLAVDGTGRWTLEGGSAIIENPFLNNSKVTKLGNGQNAFRWTITKGSCVSSALLYITNDIPTTAYAGLDQTICDNVTDLMPNTPSIGVGEWSVKGGAGSFSGNQVTGLAPGNNILRWTIRNNNCTSYDDVIITSHKPTAANAGANSVVCVDSLFMSANKPNASLGETAKWSIMNGSGIIADTSLNTTLVKRIAQGVNVLRWTINNNGCISYDDVEVNYAYVMADAGINITTCDNHIILNANNPTVGTGEWSVIGGSGTALFVNPNSPNTEVKNLDQGTNILRWTIRNYTCVSTDEVNIINNAPSASFAGGDQSLCTNTTVLAARVPLIGKGVWSVLSGSGKFADTTAFNTTVTSIGTGVNTYRWTVTNVNCVSADEVVINNNKPIGTFAGTDQTLCVDSAYLSANQPIVGSGVWSIIRGAGTVTDVYNPVTSILKLAPDTNIVRWTVTNKQCVEYKEIKLISNLPTTANAGADKTVCSNRVTLDGNMPLQGTGEWSLISGAGTFVNKAGYNSEVQNMLLGKNTFRWKITKQGCISYDDVVITNDLPSQPDAGTTISVCDNTANLNANKPLIGVGHWSVSSGAATFIDSTQYNTRVVGLGQGSNFLLWTITHNRCTMSDIVEVRNNLTNVYAGPDQMVFDNSSMLVGNEPPRGQGTWTLTAGAGTIGTPNNFESSVTGLSEGLNSFTWSVNIDGCVSSDLVQITYYKLPTASFSVNAAQGCVPHEVRFTKTTVEKYPFKWSFGENDSTSMEENPVYTYTKPGTYKAKLTVTGPDGKEVTKEKLIEVDALPVIKFDIVPQEVYIPGDGLRCYNYSEGGEKYLWNFGDGNTSTDFNPSHMYADSGYYSLGLTVWSKNQCADSLIKVNAVHVIETSSLKFPTAFSPNPNGPSGGRYDRNDYSNDVFYPIVLMGGIEDFKMEIYSRWGVLLYTTNDIEVGWDGYYKGKLMPEDVYVYKVTGRYNSGKKFTIAGDFMLVRNQ